MLLCGDETGNPNGLGCWFFLGLGKGIDLRLLRRRVAQLETESTAVVILVLVRRESNPRAVSSQRAVEDGGRGPDKKV